MVHVNHGRLTGQVGGQVYRFLREVAAFWECYLIKTPLPGGGHVYNDMNDCPYEICTDPSVIERQPALFFLGHISPIFAPFFAVFSPFSPS